MSLETSFDEGGCWSRMWEWAVGIDDPDDRGIVRKTATALAAAVTGECSLPGNTSGVLALTESLIGEEVFVRPAMGREGNLIIDLPVFMARAGTGDGLAPDIRPPS